MGDTHNTQKKTYIMALDQGTTSSRCILFDKQGNICSMAQKEFTQIYPQPGWVEHNPMEIWSSQLGVAIESMAVLGITDDQIEAIGITNQRETTIIWDKNTGEPVYNAIVWQCRRTSDMIEELKKDGFDQIIRKKTGLIPDAYFSASKIAWILNNVPGVRERAERGELLFGTVDTWLIWNLTKGAVHVTDYTNASRTMLFDIHNLCWDQEILKRFNIPESLLPKVCCSSEIYGRTDAAVLGGEIPIAGAAGDQQAALFGQCCFEQGEVKNTYGTGCFLLMNTGHEAITSQSGLLTTIAASTSRRASLLPRFVRAQSLPVSRRELRLGGVFPPERVYRRDASGRRYARDRARRAQSPLSRGVRFACPRTGAGRYARRDGCPGRWESRFDGERRYGRVHALFRHMGRRDAGRCVQRLCPLRRRAL